MKAKKTKKSVLKQFQIKENTYSVVIVKSDKNDLLEPLIYFISTLKDKTQILDGYRIRWYTGHPVKSVLNTWNPMQLHWGNQSWRLNSGGDPLRQDSKTCLMVALVIMAIRFKYSARSWKQSWEKKIYKNKPSRLAISYFR